MRSTTCRRELRGVQGVAHRFLKRVLCFPRALIRLRRPSRAIQDIEQRI